MFTHKIYHKELIAAELTFSNKPSLTLIFTERAEQEDEDSSCPDSSEDDIGGQLSGAKQDKVNIRYCTTHLIFDANY